MPIPAINIQQVSKKYPALQALNNVSLEIQQGEFFGLLGPNGAGKTTLISIIAGLAKATSGTVQIMGHDIQKNFREAKRALGVVPQELVFDPFFNVRETLHLQAGYYGLVRNDAWVDEILENLGLTDKANANMRSLSGGMKRRVLVAQALVHKPPVIVLDEPTAGVDVELRQTLWKFIKRLNQEGHTIVLTTHYLEEAEELCSRIAMLKHGKIIALDKTEQLLNNFSAITLAIRYHGGELPANLQAKNTATTEADRHFRLPLSDYWTIEQILAEFREAKLEIDELQIERPDLEDVFVHLTQNANN